MQSFFYSSRDCNRLTVSVPTKFILPYSEAINPSVVIFGDEASKIAIKVK